MSKREDLLKRLKQADKRRQRRPEPSSPPAARRPVEAELLGRTLLELFADDPAITDRQVAAAAQLVLQQRSATDPKLQELQSRFESLLSHPSTDRSHWRTELSRMVDSIRRDFAPNGPQAYLEYVRTLGN